MNTPARFCRFITWVSIFAVCLSICGSLVLAQAPPGQNVPPAQALRNALERGQWRAEQILRTMELPAVQKSLVLTDEQREKIGDISHIVRIDVIRQQAELRVQRLELQRMMQGDAPDRPAIDEKVQEVARALAALMHTRVSALLNLREILTKEQIDKMRESAARRIQERARARAQQGQPGPKLASPAPHAPPAPPAAPKPPAAPR